MINGAMQIKVGLTSEKLFMDDSPLLELVRLQSNVIFKEGGQVALTFLKAKAKRTLEDKSFPNRLNFLSGTKLVNLYYFMGSRNSILLTHFVLIENGLTKSKIRKRKESRIYQVNLCYNLSKILFYPFL